MAHHYMREFQRSPNLPILGRFLKEWAASRVEFGSDLYLWAERHLYRVTWDWCVGGYGADLCQRTRRFDSGFRPIFETSMCKMLRNQKKIPKILISSDVIPQCSTKLLISVVSRL